MKSKNVATIQEYFRCFKDRDRNSLENILAPDLVHKSPYATYADRDKMLNDIWPYVGKTWAADIRVFDNGSEFLVSYRHEGERGGHLAEKFTFTGDRISAVEVYPESK